MPRPHGEPVSPTAVTSQENQCQDHEQDPVNDCPYQSPDQSLGVGDQKIISTDLQLRQSPFLQTGSYRTENPPNPGPLRCCRRSSSAKQFGRLARREFGSCAARSEGCGRPHDGHPVVMNHALELAAHRLDLVAPAEQLPLPGSTLAEQARKFIDWSPSSFVDHEWPMSTTAPTG